MSLSGLHVPEFAAIRLANVRRNLGRCERPVAAEEIRGCTQQAEPRIELRDPRVIDEWDLGRPLGSVKDLEPRRCAQKPWKVHPSQIA